MAAFKLEIECDNDAFCADGLPDESVRGAEIARILRDLADKMEDGCLSASLRDANGNRAGFAEINEGE
jgi:hypothetical protein